jgi:AcrR family transcriptional regulator
LLDAALALFAERGISGSTMREIRIAAGQSNTAALQYHFGDLAGILRALLERELPPLVARRRELLACSDDPWSVAAVFVLPFAEMATGSEHQKLVVRFLSQLLDDHSLTFQEILDLVGDTGTQGLMGFCTNTFRESRRLCCGSVSRSPPTASFTPRRCAPPGHGMNRSSMTSCFATTWSTCFWEPPPCSARFFVGWDEKSALEVDDLAADADG